jgi:SOS-response transcriptional repressor LexA
VTDRQRRILAYVEQHFDTHGIAPSFLEICRACDISSTSVARYHCDRLADAGLLHDAGAGVARAYVPTWAVGVRTELARLRAENAALRAELETV